MPTLGICICRTAKEPLQPGYVVGYSCKICDEPLQVSPASPLRIANEGLIPMCNPCGFAMADRLKMNGNRINLEFSTVAEKNKNAEIVKRRYKP